MTHEYNDVVWFIPNTVTTEKQNFSFTSSSECPSEESEKAFVDNNVRGWSTKKDNNTIHGSASSFLFLVVVTSF